MHKCVLVRDETRNLTGVLARQVVLLNFPRCLSLDRKYTNCKRDRYSTSYRFLCLSERQTTHSVEKDDHHASLPVRLQSEITLYKVTLSNVNTEPDRIIVTVIGLITLWDSLSWRQIRTYTHTQYKILDLSTIWAGCAALVRTQPGPSTLTTDPHSSHDIEWLPWRTVPLSRPALLPWARPENMPSTGPQSDVTQ